MFPRIDVSPARRIRRCLADTRSVAALEFAIVGPVFLLFFFAILGVCLDGFYQFTLDDSVRAAARQLQIGGPAETSPANFVAAVCGEFGKLAINCATTLSYNVQASAPAAGFAALAPVPLSAAGALPDSFFVNPALNPAGTTYVNYVNYLIEVAYPLPFNLPFVAKLITYTGTGSILATVITRGEPFN